MVEFAKVFAAVVVDRGVISVGKRPRLACLVDGVNPFCTGMVLSSVFPPKLAFLVWLRLLRSMVFESTHKHSLSICKTE